MHDKPVKCLTHLIFPTLQRIDIEVMANTTMHYVSRSETFTKATYVRSALIEPIQTLRMYALLKCHAVDRYVEPSTEDPCIPSPNYA